MNIHEAEEIEFGSGPRLWDADPSVCCAAFQLGACKHTEDFEQEEEPHRYAVTSFGGFHRSWENSWFDATATAERYAQGTSLPARIRDENGQEWSKWAGQPAERRAS